MPGQLKLLSGEIPEATMIEESEILPEEPTSPNEPSISSPSEASEKKDNATNPSQPSGAMKAPTAVSHTSLKLKYYPSNF